MQFNKTEYNPKHNYYDVVIAGGAMRAIMDCVGIKDILSKSKGSSNPHNVVKATFQALINLRSASKIAAVRGISLEKVFNG